MTFRIELFFVSIALCLLSLYSANAFNPARWPKVVSVHFLHYLYFSLFWQPRLVGFSWSNCGPSTDIAQVKSLTIAPDPINIPGNITVSTSVTVENAVPLDLTLTILMEAKVAGFWIKIPCVEDVGSCNYTDICTDWAEICPTYFEKYGIPCTCPIPANTYTVSDFVTEISEDPPVKINGDIRITGNFISPTAGHLACIQVEITINS